MDRMLYVAMTGAKQNMLAQGMNSNNLANISTTGFKADLDAARSMPLFGVGYPTRVYAMTEKSGIDFTPGVIQATGRPLDVAVENEGFIAVQGTDGNEAYTRAGNLRVTPAGVLTTGSGHAVMGEGGIVSVPPYSKIDISHDGNISIVPVGADPNAVEVINRIKLVNPDTRQLYKSNDGLFRLPDNQIAPADAEVTVLSGSLEGSNVNIADAMVDMIELARQFEMQVKMMKLAEENDERATQLLQLV